MKKTAFTLLLAMATMPLIAQNHIDTIFSYFDHSLGPREPTFYYYNFNDWFRVSQDGNNQLGAQELCYSGTRIYARYNYIDSSLRVIGVAAAMGTRINDREYYVDTTIAGREPEYLQLYKPTSDSMILLKQGIWNDVQPRYKIQLLGTAPPCFLYPNIYEVYFDSAVTVTDSFYVAFTLLNNHTARDSNGEWGKAHPETCYYRVVMNGAEAQSLISSGTRYKDLNGSNTSWRGTGGDVPGGVWLFIFPIFDTTGVALDVQQPTRLAEQYTTLTPNPATTQASLFSSFRIHTVELYDTQGRLVGSRKVEDTQAQLDLTAYPKGLYMVVVTTAAGRTTKKLLIQ